MRSRAMAPSMNLDVHEPIWQRHCPPQGNLEKKSYNDSDKELQPDKGGARGASKWWQSTPSTGSVTGCPSPARHCRLPQSCAPKSKWFSHSACAQLMFQLSRTTNSMRPSCHRLFRISKTHLIQSFTFISSCPAAIKVQTSSSVNLTPMSSSTRTVNSTRSMLSAE